MSELPYTFPIRWYGDAMDAYAPFANKPGAFMIAIDKRYTLIGWEPKSTFSAKGGFVTIDGRTRIDTPATALQTFVAPFEQLPRDPYHPFYSGLVGYMQPDFKSSDTPEAWFGVYDPVIVHDQIEQKLTVLSMGFDANMAPNAVLAEELATALVQQLVHYNGKPATPEAHDPKLRFLSLEDIQAQCTL